MEFVCSIFVSCGVLFFIAFSIDLNDITSLHFDVLRGYVIPCHSIQHHFVALESDINIFKVFSFSMQDFELEPISQHDAPHWGFVYPPPPIKMAKFYFDLLCA